MDAKPTALERCLGDDTAALEADQWNRRVDVRRAKMYNGWEWKVLNPAHGRGRFLV